MYQNILMPFTFKFLSVKTHFDLFQLVSWIEAFESSLLVPFPGKRVNASLDPGALV